MVASWIFTEGGFRKNDRYNNLLAALYPTSKVACTGLQEATAFGAAILAKAALNKTTPMESKYLFQIEQATVSPPSLDGMDAYTSAFMSRI